MGTDIKKQRASNLDLDLDLDLDITSEHHTNNATNKTDVRQTLAFA